MKRILIALAFIASLQVGYAPPPMGGGAPRGGAPRGGAPAGNAAAARVTAALEAAQKDAANAKKATKLATWTKLGEAYMAAYTASMGDGWRGASQQDLALVLRNLRPVSTEEVTVNGETFTKNAYPAFNYYLDGAGTLVAVESTNPVVPDALAKALEAYTKAASLDPKGSKTKDIKAAMQTICDDYADEAYGFYTIGNMAKAYDAFKKAAEASTTAPLSTPDGEMFYSAGFTALETGAYNDALSMFQKCVDFEYFRDGEVYAKMGDAYGKLGNKALMKSTLEDAFQKFPESEGILVSLINYYLEENSDPNKLFELIAAAKAKDPKNASLYYVEGNINKELGNIEEAAKCYTESSTVDPNYEFGYIGAGVLYYDYAVELQEKAQEELDDAKYAALVEQFESALKSCIDPFEKAFNVTKDDELKVSIAEYLKNACFRFRDQAEFQAKYDKYNQYYTENL